MSKFFARNEGTVDRTFRTMLGLGILSQAFIGLQTPWAFIGLVPLATGLTGRCPLYAMFGFNTCPVRTA